MPDLTLPVFVKQIAVRLSDENVAMPLRNQRLWHMLLYRLKTAPLPGKPEFLANLWFDWDGPTPEAPELSDLLARLHWNASVSAANPQYETITVPAPVADLWKTQAPDLTVDEENFLAAATEQARQAFTAAPQEAN